MRVATSTDPRQDAIAFGMAAFWAVGAWQSNTFGIWSAVGGTAVLLGIAAVVLEGASLRAALGLRPSAIGLGLVSGLVMVAATYLLFGPVTQTFPVLLRGVVRLYADFGSISLPAALIALPIVVACEDLVWRGVVYGAFAQKMGGLAAVVAATALYAFAHAPIGSPVLLLACLGAGFCWNLIRWQSGSLVAAYVAHLVWDLALLVVHPLVTP